VFRETKLRDREKEKERERERERERGTDEKMHNISQNTGYG